MNEIANKFSLAGHKFMPKIHLRQPGFLHIVLVDHLQENKERIQKFKQRGDSRYIYENELHKASFQHDRAYGNFKDVTTIIYITF